MGMICLPSGAIVIYWSPSSFMYSSNCVSSRSGFSGIWGYSCTGLAFLLTDMVLASMAGSSCTDDLK